jgi:hypothetical protein
MNHDNSDNATKKRAYKAPQLSIFGSLSHLTQQGSGKKSEGVTNNRCGGTPKSKLCNL